MDGDPARDELEHSLALRSTRHLRKSSARESKIFPFLRWYDPGFFSTLLKVAFPDHVPMMPLVAGENESQSAHGEGPGIGAAPAIPFLRGKAAEKGQVRPAKMSPLHRQVAQRAAPESGGGHVGVLIKSAQGGGVTRAMRRAR